MTPRKALTLIKADNGYEKAMKEKVFTVFIGSYHSFSHAFICVEELLSCPYGHLKILDADKGR